MRFSTAILLASTMASLPSAAGAGLAPRPAPPEPQDQRPTFRASTDLVALAAVVRHQNGKPVTDLTRDDFIVLDRGERRPIVEFRADETPVSLALLVDFSGSMDVASKIAGAREVAGQLVSWLRPGTDRIGLFSFDTHLRELQPLEPAPSDVLSRLDQARPFGSTSLFDAIAGAGRQLASTAGPRRAVVVLTDGADNRSLLTPGEVSAVASALDVPVYIVVVMSPLDGSLKTAEGAPAATAYTGGRLADLARWTGGELYVTSGAAKMSLAARQIVTELRHQYLIGFTPGAEPGWHPIEIRTTQKDLVVRARSGYVVHSAPNLLQ